MKRSFTWLRCRLTGHRMVTVRDRRDGLLVTVPCCDRCPHVDYEGITTTKWNRSARRQAARQLARRIVR